MTTLSNPDLRASLAAALTAGGFDVASVELGQAASALAGPVLVIRLPLSPASGAEVTVVAAERSDSAAADGLVQRLAQAVADELAAIVDGDASIEVAPDLATVAGSFRSPVQVAVVSDAAGVAGAVLCAVDRRAADAGTPAAGGAFGTPAAGGAFGDPTGGPFGGATGGAFGAPTAGGHGAGPAGAALGRGTSPGLQLLRDVHLDVSVELGRADLTVSEVLELGVGSVVELDRAARAPVDVRVNGTLLARGEVVIVDDEYAVRITEIIDPTAGGDA